MRECVCILLCMLQFTDGCHVSDHGQVKDLTGYTGASLLLLCSCTDSQSSVQTFTWDHYYERVRQWTKVFQEDRYKNRLKLFDQSSPANLSLLISDLRKTDEGFYKCRTSQTFTDFLVTIKESQIHTDHTKTEHIKPTEEPTTNQSKDLEKELYILLSVLPVVLLLAVLALIFWKCRGRRDVQKTENDGLVLVCSENEEQGDVNPESVTQGKNLKQHDNVEEVTYSSVVHIKTDIKPAHIQTVMAEHSEYASIK